MRVRRSIQLVLLAFMACPSWASAAVVSSATQVDLPIASRGLPALRQQYVDAVESLAAQSWRLRALGRSPEQVARALHAARRQLGVKFKDLTPPGKLQQIYRRNLQKYGDELGPSIEWLRTRGKTWEQIIEKATKPGGGDLGF